MDTRTLLNAPLESRAGAAGPPPRRWRTASLENGGPKDIFTANKDLFSAPKHVVWLIRGNPFGHISTDKGA